MFLSEPGFLRSGEEQSFNMIHLFVVDRVDGVQHHGFPFSVVASRISLVVSPSVAYYHELRSCINEVSHRLDRSLCVWLF